MIKRVLSAALAVALLVPAAAVRAGGKGNPTGKAGSKFAKNHPRRNEVNKRVVNQRKKINRAEKSGKISSSQAKQDRQNLNQMKAQEHADVKANGGHITKQEQKQFNQEENANLQQINSQKSGGQ